MASRHKAAASEAGRLLSQLGASKGGKASAAALTAEERTARARAAVSERWKGRRKPPVDQAAVLARLNGATPVVLRIAPGAGGKRRQAAINALAHKGLVRVLDVGKDSVTLTAVKG
jgi:hypothetical protein